MLLITSKLKDIKCGRLCQHFEPRPIPLRKRKGRSNARYGMAPALLHFIFKKLARNKLNTHWVTGNLGLMDKNEAIYYRHYA